MSPTARRRLWLGGAVACVLLVVLLSPLASSAPDGLEKVAQDKGFLGTAREHALRESPVADYAVEGIANEKLRTVLAGAIGVVITFVATYVLMRLVKKRRAEGPPRIRGEVGS